MMSRKAMERATTGPPDTGERMSTRRYHSVGSHMERWLSNNARRFSSRTVPVNLIGNLVTEGQSSAVLSRQALGELFDSMKNAADEDPSNIPQHSRLLPFSHLRVRTMGGLHQLKDPVARRFSHPPFLKYVAVVSQTAILLLNLNLLFRSLQSSVSFLMGLGTMTEDLVRGHIKVGFISAAQRHNLMSLFEAMGLVWFAACLMLAGAQAQNGADEGLKGMRRWSAHATIHWDLLPALRTFSAMRMLRRVHPQLLPMQFSALFKTLQRQRSSGFRKVLALVGFFGQRLLLLYFGFQAFVFKFTTTASRLQETSSSPHLQLLISFAFLNQLLGGVIQLEKLMRNRLILFLFGGQDAHIDGEEDALMHTWLACLARTLHQQAGGGNTFRDRLRYFVAISSFNHMDLQQVVLIEDPEQVAERHLMIKKFSRSLEAQPEGVKAGDSPTQYDSLEFVESLFDPALPDGHGLMRGD